MEKRTNRSQKYQNLFLEIASSHESLDLFSNEDSISGRLNPYGGYDDELLELQEQLRVEFWRVVETLTERQQEVIKLSATGLTQMEIAKKLNVNQSSITKSLHGNVDYKKGRKTYGGSETKLRKIVSSDPKIQEILKKMKERIENRW